MEDKTPLARGLEPAQIEQFINDGYVRLDEAFPREVAGAAREILATSDDRSKAGAAQKRNTGRNCRPTALFTVNQPVGRHSTSIFGDGIGSDKTQPGGNP